MSAPLIDVYTFSERVRSRDWDGVSSCLVEGMKRLTSQDEIENCFDILNAVANALNVAVSALNKNEEPSIIIAMSECFRFLRNCSAGRKEVQNILIRTDVYQTTSRILESLLSEELGDETLVCVKVCVQFIGNSIVGSQTNQVEAWNTFSAHLCQLLSSDDESLLNCTCMVFFNILLGKVEGILNNVERYLPHLLKCYEKGSEFAVFSVEYLLQQERVLQEVYPKLESENRLKILDAILSLLMNSDEERDGTSESSQFHLSSLLFLVEQLKKSSDSILRIVENGMSAEPRETLRLIDVIACASSRSQYLNTLQSDGSLLINVSYLLKNVTEIGKAEGGNIFSSAQRLSDVNIDKEKVQEHPIFGFKASLIRLLGNLCHHHKNNQNQVRELGCLPAVLDVCNIDAYNPLLLQWGVLAVQNLLEDNSANQEVVAGLVSKGPASCTVLRELGLELHQDEKGSICLAPLKRQ